MPYRQHLNFLFHIIKDKNEYQGSVAKCPFCDKDALTDIIASDGDILLLKNKFATLESTFQTVIIETDDCSADMSNYSEAHMNRLISFALDQWQIMDDSGKYKSVILYKNHGPLSGGTIDHAHMQIIGMECIDYRDNLYDEMFEGIEITRDGDCLLNISTKPHSCATEYNIILPERNDAFLAETIQTIVRFVLRHCNSYNLFFYQWKGSIICKISPRYVTSPFLVGYDIPPTTNRIPLVVEELSHIFMQVHSNT